MTGEKKYTELGLFLACFLTACLTASSVSITHTYLDSNEPDITGELNNIENMLYNLTLVQDTIKQDAFNYTTIFNPDFGVVTVGNLTFLDGYYTNISTVDGDWEWD